MNTVYLKTEKSQRKIKTFATGQKENALKYGFNLAYKNQTKSYFVITEDEKCLKCNTNVIL